MDQSTAIIFSYQNVQLVACMCSNEYSIFLYISPGSKIMT